MVRSSSPSMVHVRLKLVRVVHRHQQMKAAFNNLRSQIKSGLIEAEDVFASLSIPLMKLVGLKTDEMAEQGRSTTILTGSTPPPLQFFRRHASTDLHVSSGSGSGSGTGKKLIHQQRLQLQQLVHLLRGIESRVNSRHNNLLDTLHQQRLRLHHLFHNSIRHLSSFHQHTTTPTDEAPFLVPTLNIFHATFKHVASAFASVHNGVEDLIADLAQHMCRPMTDYAKSLKAQMDAGALLRLVSLVENMEAAQLQLDQARGKAKLEEDTKLQALTMLRDSEQRELEALNKLRDSENKTLAITQFVAFLLDSQKFLAMEGDQAGDEKLLWDLVKENKHVKAQASPLGTKELLHVESSKNHKRIGDNKNSGRTEHKASYRPVTRSFTKGFSTGSPFTDAWLRLGSSPSGVDQTVGHKQASPLLRIRRGTPHQ